MIRTFATAPRRWIALALLAIAQSAVGCHRDPAEQPLPTSYGQGESEQFEASVNSLTVLAGMFTKAGHKVSHAGGLAPQLSDNADVIVWAPEEFTPPDQKTVDWYEAWLKAKPTRTLIYIGRDFDAAPLYWRKALAQTPPQEQAEVKAELAEAEDEVAAARQEMPESGACPWFAINKSAPPRAVRALEGDWSEGIDASKVEIELKGRIDPVGDAEELLYSGDDALVSRITRNAGKPTGIWPLQRYPTSQILLIANGSFLLNLPLVNHEHRKLAAELVKSVGTEKRVVFLESEDGGTVRSSGGGDHEQELSRSMLDIVGVWPLGVILAQWGLVVLLFCFSRWPIFGTPRDPAPTPASDFGRHVAALGEALEYTRDETFARSRWQHYQDQVRSKGGGLLTSGRSAGSGGRKPRPEKF